VKKEEKIFVSIIGFGNSAVRERKGFIFNRGREIAVNILANGE